MSELIDKMIIYRAKHRLTQGELAELCGVSKMTINQIENGIQRPSKVTFAKIMLVIGKDDE